MRIISVAALVAIIVAGGVWLARDRGAEPGSVSEAPAVETTAEGAAPTSTRADSGTDPQDDTRLASARTAGAEAPEDTGTGGATDMGEADVDEAGDTEVAAEGEPSDPEAPADDADAADDADVSDDAGASADSDGAPDDSTTSDDSTAPDATAATLPEGFTQVDYLTDTPRQAFDAPEQVLDPNLDYAAVIRTNRGDITVDLFEERTPTTVNNFVFLALNRYYDDVPFHRVIDGFMAQTGDPTGTGTGGPGYQFDDEIDPDLAFDGAGLLAMANAGPGTNGSQFFITFEATPWLTGAHTIFGRVIDGMDVLPEITRIDPSQPSAVVTYDGTVADLAAQGVELPAEPDDIVIEAIEELLGARPSPGQSFSVAGYRGVAGQLGDQPALGFFLNPDVLESVVIATRPK